MSDNLILELLRAIRADIARLADRLDEHGDRLSHMEIGMAALRRDQASEAEGSADMGYRLDKLRGRLDSGPVA